MKELYYKCALLLMVFITLTVSVCGQQQAKVTAFRPGEVWPDENGQHINAHGGGVMKYGDTYYWFGEHKAEHTSSALVGVTCYASEDLLNWRNCGVALSVTDQRGHDIERGCVLERPKVIFNKVTGKFSMWFHLELKGQGYNAARYGYIDDVIEPRNTRFRIIRALTQLENKKLHNPAKKHGNIPL